MATKTREWAPTERDQFQHEVLSFGYRRPVEQYSQQFVMQCLKLATVVVKKLFEKFAAVERLQESLTAVTTWSILEGSATSWARWILNLQCLYEVFNRHRNKNVDIFSGIQNSTMNYENSADWWSVEDHRCLLRGTCIHGYENFVAVPEDSSLSFGTTFAKKSQHQKQFPTPSLASGIRSRHVPNVTGGIAQINDLKTPDVSAVTAATLTSPPTSPAGSVLTHPLHKNPKLIKLHHSAHLIRPTAPLWHNIEGFHCQDSRHFTQ